MSVPAPASASHHRCMQNLHNYQATSANQEAGRWSNHIITLFFNSWEVCTQETVIKGLLGNSMTGFRETNPRLLIKDLSSFYKGVRQN